MPSRESPKFKKTLQAVHLNQTKQTGIRFGSVGFRVEFKKTLQAVHLNQTKQTGIRFGSVGFRVEFK